MKTIIAIIQIIENIPFLVFKQSPMTFINFFPGTGASTKKGF